MTQAGWSTSESESGSEDREDTDETRLTSTCGRSCPVGSPLPFFLRTFLGVQLITFFGVVAPFNSPIAGAVKDRKKITFQHHVCFAHHWTSIGEDLLAAERQENWRLRPGDLAVAQVSVARVVLVEVMGCALGMVT